MKQKRLLGVLLTSMQRPKGKIISNGVKKRKKVEMTVWEGTTTDMIKIFNYAHYFFNEFDVNLVRDKIQN